jgi:hypothetical protein
MSLKVKSIFHANRVANILLPPINLPKMAQVSINLAQVSINSFRSNISCTAIRLGAILAGQNCVSLYLIFNELEKTDKW